MAHLRVRIGAVAATLVFSTALALSAHAQTSSPPLSRMPPPPSSGDPAPRESAAPTPKKSQSRKGRATKASNDDMTFGEPAPSRGRNAGSGSYQRPQKYVPEEFDRSGSGGGGGGRMEPTMSSSGRPGMGMRF